MNGRGEKIGQGEKGGQADRDGAESLPTWLYNELRALIIEGALPPGTHLRERELAERFNVSRIPLREALPQLEAEGFIVTLARRGAVVTQLTLRDVRELIAVRLGVEVAAVRMATLRVAEGASVVPLSELMDKASKILAAGDPSAIAGTNADLHDAIVDLAGNTLLSNMMRFVQGRNRWIFRLTSSRDPVQACSEHQQLCDAIAAGDPNLAGAIAYAHIEHGREPTMSALKSILPPS